MNSKVLAFFVVLIIAVAVGLLYWSSKKDIMSDKQIDKQNEEEIVQSPEVSAYISSGWNKENDDNYAGAIEDYSKAIEKALELGTVTSTLYSFRADARQYTGDYKGAVEDYTNAIKLDPKPTVLYWERAEAKERMNDYKGALEDVTKAISLSEGSGATLASLYAHRAKIKKHLGDEAGAKADKEKEKEIQEKFGFGWE